MIVFSAGELVPFVYNGETLSIRLSVASWSKNSKGYRVPSVRTSGALHVVPSSFGGLVDFCGGDEFTVGADFSGAEEPVLGLRWDDVNEFAPFFGFDLDTDDGDVSFFESDLLGAIYDGFVAFVTARLAGGVA